MRTTTTTSILGFVALLTAMGCTVKDVDQPALAGPSTFAHSIMMTATTDTLTQNGVDFTDITIMSLSPTGQSENIPLRAQIFVDGVAQDFGTLSTKTPTTPTTIRYTAPATPAQAVAQVPTTVTLRVTPTSNGDFRSEFARELDIRLVPQGIILPTNPNLVANFTFSPPDPKAFDTTTFDASTTTFNGSACGLVCGYSWNFGDGTTGTGIAVTHQYRTFGNIPVTLTVTDPRGAQAVNRQVLTVGAPTPPEAVIEVTPAGPVVGQDVFFSAARTTSPSGRAISSYAWDFGDGSSGSGVTTSHRYSTVGSYTVILRVTDDVGTVDTERTTVTVAAGGPTVSFTFLPSSPSPNDQVTVNITATPQGATTITSYNINWGDGSPVETVAGRTQSHVYGKSGQFVIAVTANDSLGHSTTVTQAVTVK